MNTLQNKNITENYRRGTVGPYLKQLNILLLEHNENSVKLIEESLKEEKVNYILKSVVTSKDFTKALHQFKPAIILVDCNESDFSRLQAVQLIKRDKIDIPVIILADPQFEKEAVNCVKEGAKDYILKSDLARLPELVYKVVGKYGDELEAEKPGEDAELFSKSKLFGHFVDILGEVDTGFMIIEASTKKIIMVNEAFSKMCMYTTNEIYGLPSLMNLINKKNLGDFENELNKLLQPHSPVRIFNSVLVRKDNKKVNIEFIARQFTQNNSNRIIFILRDITEIVTKSLKDKLREEALRESERLYRSMIENVKDYAIFILDYNGRIIRWNYGAERILSYTDNEILMKNFETFFPVKDDSGFIVSNMLQQAKINGTFEAETELVKKNGMKFWALITITRLENGNSETGILSIIIHDLTKNKNSEEQLHEQQVQLRSLAKHLQDAREEERLRIARELHDEFSQMLTVLRMDLSVLSHTISKTVSEPLKRISLVEKISSISDILEKTIRSTRRIITELRPAVLDELGLFTAIQWQAQEFENRTGIRCKIIKLKHDINIDKNTSTAIFRILQEGLINVAKHSAATSVIISLSFQNDELRLEIKDNGKGFDKNKLKSPTSTGLLGIRERVMAFKGNLDIQSKQDKGTILIATVPYKEGN